MLSGQFSLVISEALLSSISSLVNYLFVIWRNVPSYSAGFKLKVIDYAEKHGNQAAGHEFSVTEFNVRYWSKQKLALQNTNKSRKAFQGPKSGKIPDETGFYLITVAFSLCIQR
jgi:hypothetical protein